MKRAYEYDRELIENAVPVVLAEEEQTWELAFDMEKANWMGTKVLWGSNVPGSGAPERVLVAGIQSMYNMGYDVTEAEKLIPEALEALEKEDKVTLARLTARVFNILNTAKQIEGHPYLQYTVYDDFDKYAKAVDFPQYPAYDVTTKDFHDRIHAGWVAQIAGAALGTAVEGYTAEAILKAFGEVNNYVRKPSTYNDDVTYEIAFLEAFDKFGKDVTSAQIAEEWVSLIPLGWSAEDIALKNISKGVYPPESGYLCNPYREWIGAQMRGAICGMVAPGNPKLAAEYAFRDGVVSHHNNGVIGEIFNAVMCSIAFCETDIKEILKKAIAMVPTDSEYYTVIDFAWKECEKADNYRTAWAACEKQFIEYNWIHAYPNAAAEVVALYFCGNDFDTCMNIISMVGQDVDCNAAQIMTIFGIAYGIGCIDKRWTDPIRDDIQSYVRGYEKTTITAITEKTVNATKKSLKLN